MPFPLVLEQNRAHLPKEVSESLLEFYTSYSAALKAHQQSISAYESLFVDYLNAILEQFASPTPFDTFHRAIRSPFDFYQFGLDIIRPLIVFEKSKLEGKERLLTINTQLARGENVILFANHQTEPDPQIISLMIEKHTPQLAQNMIFVAGHRVITDPLAIPFSKGRNLLCIYSKKYMETSPEYKAERQLHNQRTMHRMAELLEQGGACIYVAPSGGRDRATGDGQIEVAPFDSQSIEMFYLVAKQAQRLTHFYPLALSTYNLLPPPQSIQIQIGEHRQAERCPVHLSFGEKIDMQSFPGSETADKKQKRQARAQWIWELVKRDYTRL